MKRRYVYLITVLFFTIGIATILYVGHLNTNTLSTDTSFQFVTADGIFSDFKNLLAKQFHHPLALLLTQIIIIMIATRFFGLVATKILLPIVVGEIAAGILLGSSFLGSLFPDFSAALFPVNSLGNLSMISQIGLRTQIGLMETSYHWMICVLIITVAVVGKLFGAAISSKFMGFSWKDSFKIGALMNTKGLMELIVLNIGFELGIIGAELFAIFVIMALVTTAMTGPLLYLIDKKN